VTGYPRHYGKYILLEPIGAGGMSEVDLAHRGMDDTSFVRFVAIKRVARSNLADESYVRMFMDEARINAELHHGNIVGVYDFGKQLDDASGREEYFMVMEYVPGLDLRALQRAAHALGHRLPLRFCFSVLHEVLQGLQYAHTKVDTLGRPMNLVHRDINPRNVMVSVRGEVKVIDFGVALAEDRLEKTQGRSLKGKFAYMSPEQIEGNVSLDGRTDLYAVGLMLHELVAGVGPFHGLTELQIMHRIVMGQIPALQVPPEFPDGAFLQALHARSLARDRDQRFPDARSFRKELERAADMVGGLATQDERAALVRSLAPQQVDGIAARLKGYHESSHSVSRSIVSNLPPQPGEAVLGGAESTAEFAAHTQALPHDEQDQPHGRGRAWLLLVVAMVGGMLLVVGGGTVALVLKGLNDDRAPPPPSLSDLVDEPGEVDVVPEPAAEPVAREGTPPAAGTAVKVGERAPPSAGEPPSGRQGGASGSAGGDEAASTPSTGAAGDEPRAATTSEPGATTPPSVEPGSAGDEEPAGSPEDAPDEPEAEPVEPEAAPVEPDPPVEPRADGPKGELLVNSSPRGLAVTIDGVSVGTTPYKGQHYAGAIAVVVIGPGGQRCEKQATVSTSRPTPVLCRFSEQQGASQDDESRRRR
jgi:serine/threonine protein kinase